VSMPESAPLTAFAVPPQTEVTDAVGLLL